MSVKEDIKQIIWISLDLCGSWTDEVKDYCTEEILDFNSKQVQNICFEAVTSYGKYDLIDEAEETENLKNRSQHGGV